MSYPTSVPASVSKVLDAFYSLSDLSPKDDPKTHEKYAALFVSDKPSCIAPQGIFTSNADIQRFRQMAWEGVDRRKHTVREVFLSPASSFDAAVPEAVVIAGHVDFWLADGSTKSRLAWMGRMQFEMEEGELKVKHYQVSMTPAQQWFADM